LTEPTRQISGWAIKAKYAYPDAKTQTCIGNILQASPKTHLNSSDQTRKNTPSTQISLEPPNGKKTRVAMIREMFKKNSLIAETAYRMSI